MNNNLQYRSVYLTKGNCISPLGFSLQENITNIKAYKTGIEKINDFSVSDEIVLGAIIDKKKLNHVFSKLQLNGNFSTLEKFFLIAVNPIKKQFTGLFNERCGLILSTTKGNIDALSNGNEENYYLFKLGKKIARTIGITNEPIIVSNACVSGIMSISVAQRLIRSGVYDHCIVLGGDLFSKFVISGFQGFQAVSNKPCRPYDKSRDGITLGEAGAATFLTFDRSIMKDESLYYEICGSSSINDANHISGPSRTGEGLFQSIQNALKEAQMGSSEIDCISSHGTATLYNDEMEAQAFNRANLQEVPTFSLKGYYGHTLGAAGLLETVISLALAEENLIPKSLGYKNHGVTLPLTITKELVEKPIHTILKTASGFGGSNTAAIFKKIEYNGK